MKLFLGGRGRVSPHINLGLSILPTATQQWQADKTLYYSPIGPMAGTSPHQFAGTLREVGARAACCGGVRLQGGGTGIGAQVQVGCSACWRATGARDAWGRGAPAQQCSAQQGVVATQWWSRGRGRVLRALGPQGMLMYFSPLKKVAALEAWAKMDEELQAEVSTRGGPRPPSGPTAHPLAAPTDNALPQGDSCRRLAEAPAPEKVHRSIKGGACPVPALSGCVCTAAAGGGGGLPAAARASLHARPAAGARRGRLAAAGLRRALAPRRRRRRRRHGALGAGAAHQRRVVPGRRHRRQRPGWRARLGAGAAAAGASVHLGALPCWPPVVFGVDAAAPGVGEPCYRFAA